jgi:P-type conjugative transfer protein TrbG
MINIVNTLAGIGLMLLVGVVPANANPSKDVSKPTQSELTKTAAQKWQEKTGRVALGKAGRVVVTYGQSIPTLVCRPGIVCLIELELGENVEDTPIPGDSLLWEAEIRRRVTSSGLEQVYFAFKPAEDAPELTNFVILTDRRVYSINLVKDENMHTQILSFDYPDTRSQNMAAAVAKMKVQKAKKQKVAKAKYKKKVAKTGTSTSRGIVPADQLNFNFRVNGKAPFKPIRVYTDGRKTYVDLPPKYRGDLPVVIGGRGESNKAFNVRTAKNGTQLIIDRVLISFVLQHGKKRITVKKG